MHAEKRRKIAVAEQQRFFSHLLFSIHVHGFCFCFCALRKWICALVHGGCSPPTFCVHTYTNRTVYLRVNWSHQRMCASLFCFSLGVHPEGQPYITCLLTCGIRMLVAWPSLVYNSVPWARVGALDSGFTAVVKLQSISEWMTISLVQFCCAVGT